MPLFANYRTSLMLVRRDKNFKKQNERIFAFLQYRKMNGFSWQQKFEPQIGKVSASYQIHISSSILWTWTGYIKIETGTQQTYQRNTFGVLQLPAQRKNGKAQNQSLIVSGKFCSRWGALLSYIAAGLAICCTCRFDLWTFVQIGGVLLFCYI